MLVKILGSEEFRKTMDVEQVDNVINLTLKLPTGQCLNTVDIMKVLLMILLLG